MCLVQLPRNRVTGRMHQPEQGARRERATREVRRNLHLCTCFKIGAVSDCLRQPLPRQANRM